MEAKDIVNAGRAVEAAQAPADERPAAPKKWRFVKTGAVCQKLRFKDKTEFQFTPVRVNSGGRLFASSAVVETDDKKLAENLRALARTGDFSLVEV